MEIVHQPEARRFALLSDEGEMLGEIDYRAGKGRVNAIRTFVKPAWRGQGHARALLDALVQYARDQGARVIPVCSFAKDEFARHPEKYADVI